MVGDTIWMLHAHSRIKFVEVLLDVIVGMLRRRMTLVYIVAGVIAAQTVFLCMWSSLFVTVLKASTSRTSAWVLALLLLLSLRWTCGLIKHVVTVSVAGTVMSYLQVTHLVDGNLRFNIVHRCEGALPVLLSV